MSQQTEQANPETGVTISLSAEQLKALGLDAQAFRQGAAVSLRATATVRRDTPRADASDAADGGADGGADDPDGDDDAADDTGAALTLNITRLEVAQARREAASVLYGGKPAR
jgi:hypothetical protein